MATTDESSPELVQLLVRNPSASFSQDLRLKISLETTIQALKERLREEYEGHPPPSHQKLIISGQIVKDGQLLKDVLKHQNLSEPTVVHLVIAAKPDGSSSSTPPNESSTATRTPLMHRLLPRTPATHGPTAPLTQPQLPLGGQNAGASSSNPPRRPPPPAPENDPSGVSGLGRDSTAGTSGNHAAPSQPRNIVQIPVTGGSTRVGSQSSAPSAGPQNTLPLLPQDSQTPAPPRASPQVTPNLGARVQENNGSLEQQMAQLLQQLNPPTATAQGPSSQGGSQSATSQEGAGPSGSGQTNGTPPGGTDPAAGLSQEALQQLYLQLLQSNPFLTPLACNLAALSMGVPPPTTNAGGPPSLAALFPGFNLAEATQGGVRDQGGREQQQAAPVQGGPIAGIFQAPGGGFADNRPFGHPLQAAQIFLHPGGPVPPQVFPPDADLRQRGGQNGAQAPPPLGQFGMPQGVPIVVRVRRIQIDFMLIAKLAVIVFVLNQDGSIPRLVLLTFLAVFAYLYQTGVLTPYIRLGAERFQRMLQQQGRQPAPAGVNQGAPANPGHAPNPAAGGALAGAVQRQRAGGGILREIQLFVMGFITSLLPGFQPPEAMPEPGQVPPPQGGQGGVPADERPHRD